jgi:hypothetical protein
MRNRFAKEHATKGAIRAGNSAGSVASQVSGVEILYGSHGDRQTRKELLKAAEASPATILRVWAEEL